MDVEIQGRVLMPGSAEGGLLASRMPLSFWGGYDQSSGAIIDRRHDLSGQIASNKILAFPYTKGSSTTTAIILESVRAGVAPAGFIMHTGDHFIALACVVANEMYDVDIPLVVVNNDDFERIVTASGSQISMSGSGLIRL